MKRIEIEDLAKYQIPGGLKYSPDGTKLAFQVTKADTEKNKYSTDIWIARDGKARKYTFSGDSRILFWEDGETLIISRKGKEEQPGKTELFSLSMQGGEAAPWMTLPFALGQMEKYKDYYLATGTVKVSDPDAYKDKEEVRKQKAEEEKKEKDYEVLDEIPYWFNGEGFTNGRRTALFSVRPGKDGGAECRRLTSPDFNVDGRIVVSGDHAWFTGARQGRVQSLTNQLYRFDGKITCLYPGKDYGIGGPFVLNGQLYFQATDMKAYGCNQTPDVCVLEDRRIRKVYTPKVTLYSSVIGDTAEGGDGAYTDGTEYLTLATVDDHNAIFSLKPSGDGKELTCRTIWEEPGMLCDLDACGDKIAVIYQDWGHVAEVFEMNRDGTGMTQITELNSEAIRGVSVAEPQRIDYVSGGEKLHGWVLRPTGFSRKKKYPAILDIHGGPRCVYGETFFHEMQVWAARGFFVFFTNIRGSDGRGDDFADIRGDYGGTDYRNLMDFTDAVLKAYGNIDPERVCVTGGSYGGFMTNWIIGHTDRFCCAASQRSISNWTSFAYISDIGAFFAADQNGAKGLTGEGDVAALWEHSPLKYAGNVKTPTLFIHSDEDYRCPLAEGMQMMQAVALQGVETRMCLFHGENHELSRSGKPLHRIRRLKEMTEWFERHTAEDKEK